MSRPTIEQLRKALQAIHEYAIGESTTPYMSIPAQPNHDADLLLGAALDELEKLRSLLGAPGVHRGQVEGVTAERMSFDEAARASGLTERQIENLHKNGTGHDVPPVAATPARKIEFWSCDPDAERLSHDELEEAVEMHLDGAGLELIEWPIKVYGWARMAITDREITDLSARLAEDARRHFDEDVHGDPDGDHQVLNEDAEQRLDTVIAETLLQARKDGELSSWSCEVIETREVTESEARQWFPQWFAENAVDPVTAPGR